MVNGQERYARNTSFEFLAQCRLIKLTSSGKTGIIFSLKNSWRATIATWFAGHHQWHILCRRVSVHLLGVKQERIIKNFWQNRKEINSNENSILFNLNARFVLTSKIQNMARKWIEFDLRIPEFWVKFC